MSKATRAGYDRLISIAEVLLDVHKVVTSNALRAAVHNFRYVGWRGAGCYQVYSKQSKEQRSFAARVRG